MVKLKINRVIEALLPLEHTNLFAKKNREESSVNIYIGKGDDAAVLILKEDGTWRVI